MVILIRCAEHHPLHKGAFGVVTDKGHLPLPMGEVPEAERAIFTLSVGFAASSPRVGAKGEREERIVTEGNPQGGSTKGSPY